MYQYQKYQYQNLELDSPEHPHHMLLTLNILKSMMYCGVVWGLYNQGWAISSDASGYIFPFWFNSVQAMHYAKQHWPNYTPRKITADDFKNSLLPLLHKFDVRPSLYLMTHQKFKFNPKQMKNLFFTPAYPMAYA